MVLWGTMVNALTILMGSLLGLIFKKGLSKRTGDTMIQSIGLAVCVIGVAGALKGMEDIVLLILFMAVGTFLGAVVDIDEKIHRLGQKLEKKYTAHDLSKGFVTATLIYCVGAMAVMGALDSGLRQDHSVLYSKAVLDGVTSIILASTLGVGVAFSALAVFIYQGAIALAASWMSGVLTDLVIIQMSALGGMMILGLGLSIVTGKSVKVANMLPSLILPVLFQFFL